MRIEGVHYPSKVRPGTGVCSPEVPMDMFIRKLDSVFVVRHSGAGLAIVSASLSLDPASQCSLAILSSSTALWACQSHKEARLTSKPILPHVPFFIYWPLHCGLGYFSNFLAVYGHPSHSPKYKPGSQLFPLSNGVKMSPIPSQECTSSFFLFKTTVRLSGRLSTQSVLRVVAEWVMRYTGAHSLAVCLPRVCVHFCWSQNMPQSPLGCWPRRGRPSASQHWSQLSFLPVIWWWF